MSDVRAGQRFALVLREAIRVSGLTLDALQRRLADVGVHVGRSTLSYWQNGERLPTGPRSLIVVGELERILAVTSGTLIEALGEPVVLREVEDFEVVGNGKRIEALIGEIGCTSSYAATEVFSYQDFASLGPDGSLDNVLTVLTFRAQDELDRYPAVHGGEAGGDPQLIHVEAVSGARIGRVRRDPQSNVIVSELVFDRQLRRGDTHVVRWITHDDNTIPTVNAYMFGGAVRTLVSLEMTFDPACLPVAVEEFEQQHDAGPDRFRRSVVLGVDRRVTLVRERQRRGIIGLRWQYS